MGGVWENFREMPRLTVIELKFPRSLSPGLNCNCKWRRDYL